MLGSLLMSSVAFADTNAPQQGGEGRGFGRGMMMRHIPGIFGTVASVNGTTLTVESKMGPRPQQGTSQSTGTTYTVDASNATVTKGGSASTVSAIAVGDTVMVQGTVNGTSVVAKVIRDLPAQAGGIPPKGGEGRGGLSPIVQGNGQPVIGGSVSAISGSTLSVATAQGGITYSVNASSATIYKDHATSSLSAISVGDKVVVQGAVSGTSVTASTIMDHGAAAGVQSPDSDNDHPGIGGFFGRLGGLLRGLFGFF